MEKQNLTQIIQTIQIIAEMVFYLGLPYAAMFACFAICSFLNFPINFTGYIVVCTGLLVSTVLIVKILDRVVDKILDRIFK